MNALRVDVLTFRDVSSSTCVARPDARAWASTYCPASCVARFRREGAVVAPRCDRSARGAKSAASFTAVSVVAASLVFAAATSEGYRTTSTDLHDGTVWTLSTDRNAAARINARIDEFDTMVRTDVSDAQLYQDGTSVYLQTAEGFAQLNSIGTNIASNVQFAKLDAGSQIGVAGRTASVLGPDGRLWVVPSQALSSVDPLQTEPLVEVGAGSRLAVSPDGVAVVLDPDTDTVTTVTNRSDSFETADGQFEISEPEPFGHDLPEPGLVGCGFPILGCRFHCHGAARWRGVAGRRRFLHP